MPLRVIFRRAIEDGDLAVNPTSHLRLPAVRGRRERIASPEEAQQLVDALPERDRALWATSLYAGLRRGELMALRWEDPDLAQGVVHVERSYDEKARVEDPAEEPCRETYRPLVGALRDELLAHKARERRDAGLVFGSTETKPFVTSNVWRRAQVAWRHAGLNPIGLHEARHTFASTLIAAGVNAKAITTYMGHASIQTTYDLYGKLMPGSEAEAAALVDAYLTAATHEAALSSSARVRALHSRSITCVDHTSDVIGVRKDVSTTVPTRRLADIDRELRRDPEYEGALAELAPYEAIARQLVSFRIENGLHRPSSHGGAECPSRQSLASSGASTSRSWPPFAGSPMPSTRTSSSTSRSVRRSAVSTWPPSEARLYPPNLEALLSNQRSSALTVIAAALVDAYLDCADTRARPAHLEDDA